MLVRDLFDETENLESFKTFMKEYGDIEYQASFSSWSGKKNPKRTDGLVSTYDLLEELANASAETADNFDVFLEDYGDLEVVSEKGDNTYNYNGFLDHYINFNVLYLENDQMLVSLAVGTGLDPRYGYTKNVLMVFDDEDSFLYALSTGYSLFSCEARANDKTYEVDFSGSATSECGLLSIFDSETGEQIFCDEVLLDSTDQEDIQTTVEEILESKVAIENLCYYWDALC